VEVGYSLPAKLLAKMKLRQVRFFVNAYNLLSFDSLKQYNLDPEVPDAGVSGYPVMKVYNTGVNVNF